MFDYEDLPSPLYLSKRSCVFVEFWKLLCDVPTARAALNAMKLEAPEGWRLGFDARNVWPTFTPFAFGAPRSGATFTMVSVSAPWDLALSTNEVVAAMASKADDIFKAIGERLRGEWPDARCATAEFWDTEVHLPVGAYIQTENGWVRDPWELEKKEKGDD